MDITSSININSKAGIVFSWLASPEKARQWMRSVAETEILHETQERVGTTFREVVAEEGGRIEMQGSITGFEQDREISFHLFSKIHELDVDYRVEEIGTGIRVTVDSSIHWKFPVNVLSLFMGGKMRSGITDQLGKELEELKKLCEAPGS